MSFAIRTFSEHVRFSTRALPLGGGEGERKRWRGFPLAPAEEERVGVRGLPSQPWLIERGKPVVPRDLRTAVQVTRRAAFGRARFLWR